MSPALPQQAFEIVVIAASAGGIAALRTLLSCLPADFPVPIAVVQHLDPRYRSVLPEILGRHTRLRVKHAADGERLEPGTVYIAPPNWHLLITPDHTVTLDDSKLVHFVRPSADLLFESVAASYKDSVIAVVLTGTGADAAAGVVAVKDAHGIVIAQDEASSEFFGMPSAAVATGDVDFVLSLQEIPVTINKLVNAETND